MGTRYRKLFAAPVLLFLGVLAACLGACGSGDLPLDQVDPAAAPLHPTFDEVNGVLRRACVPCHDSGEDDAASGSGADHSPRALAGVEPDLGTCAGIIVALDAVAQSIFDDSMPPGAWPRLTEPEKLTIRRWINDGAPAPCN